MIVQTTLETVEQAEWRIEGQPRMSDSAVHALALLAIDLGEAAEREAEAKREKRSVGFIEHGQ